jgi:hypothetical protein
MGVDRRGGRGEGIDDAVHVAVYFFVNIDHLLVVRRKGRLRGEGCGGRGGGREFGTCKYHFQFLFCDVFCPMMSQACI